ncbi:glucosaminidase domain-containing protein [Colwellia sp. 12G3]|uniref:glucosaminidase domain-containing protein n=1 Tax=Colwellia sp. 12G3 TaxID=2058299 RepID=UPI000C34116F|nr:glucosaminidase domain-containing protein [Colwellia sp. 12G3]PKI13089.1 glucosaminidase [Colwellia sp. 12G3]
MIKKLTPLIFMLMGTISSLSFAHNDQRQFEEIEIHSLDDLMSLFKKHHYTSKDWQNGNREVPRLTFSGVSENWKTTSNQITVKQKKQVFFRLMAPLVLISNENITAEREVIKSAPLSSKILLAIAKKYRLINTTTASLTSDQRQQLLQQVDIMPPSLALAQAAEESGWANSRFTEEGNAFFGQWDFSGKGMTPKQQRKELGNYGLARFDSPLASVEGYMFNINITGAYKKLRVLRAKLRQENKAITGLELAGTLDKYSERGQAYIDGLRSMIRYNKLEDVDEAFLSDTILIKLVSPKS